MCNQLIIFLIYSKHSNFKTTKKNQQILRQQHNNHKRK